MYLLQQTAEFAEQLQYMQKDGLDVAWLQTTEEVHLLVPAEQEVHKSDLSFQVLPQKLHLAVKGETLLSGDLPESVDMDGMHDLSHTIMHTIVICFKATRWQLAVQVASGPLKIHQMAA